MKSGRRACVGVPGFDLQMNAKRMGIKMRSLDDKLAAGKLKRAVQKKLGQIKLLN